jgi:hypothetical protein
MGQIEMEFDMPKQSLTDARIHPVLLAALGVPPTVTCVDAQLRLATERLTELATKHIKRWRVYRVDAEDVSQLTCIRLCRITADGTFDPSKCKAPINFIRCVINKVVLEDLRQMRRRDGRERTYIELKPNALQDPADIAEREELLRLARQGYFAASGTTKIRNLQIDFRPQADDTE